MSGHSKWATIKRKKGAADAKRSRVFTKLIKELTIAARMGGGDPSGNPRLRLAIDKAKAESLPKDNIEKAIKRGTGELEGTTIEEVSYEGYGPGGVALVIDCTTDNSTRTVADVRSTLSKRGGNMGASGSVSWMFEKKGVIRIAAQGQTEDALMEKVLEAGGDDLVREDDSFVVYTRFEDFNAVHDALQKEGVKISDANVEKIAKNTVMLTDVERAQHVLDLIEALEDSDDVQNVWSNFEIDEAVMGKLSS